MCLFTNVRFVLFCAGQPPTFSAFKDEAHSTGCNCNMWCDEKYGVDAVMKPILEDIKKLVRCVIFDACVSLTVVNRNVGIPPWCSAKKVGCTLIPADNLASSALGGFKEGSQAFRGCRHCLATPAEMKSAFRECQFHLHDPFSHSDKCDELEAAPTQKDRDKFSTEFGINRRSILDELKHFKVCDGGLVQDVMHDVLEGMHLLCCMFSVANKFSVLVFIHYTCHVGMLEYETKELLLRHTVTDTLYSLDDVNQQILSIELGYMESRDRPSVISASTLSNRDHKLKREGIHFK